MFVKPVAQDAILFYLIDAHHQPARPQANDIADFEICILHALI